MKSIFSAIITILLFSSCTNWNRVEPNYEGVLMTNYGRAGITDFKLVTGSQGMLWFGSELYQVPMFEQKADPAAIQITAKDGGVFTVDPTYTYQAIRGQGANIVFNYKHVGLGDGFMDNIENNILNQKVTDTYREEARNFSTDSLMNNVNTFENKVELRLDSLFAKKYFLINSLTSGLKPPASMSAAIEAWNNAIQQAEQVKNELQVAQMNLEKARIDAEANRVRTTGLSNANLQEMYIKMLQSTSNKVIITDGKTPVMLSGQ